MDGRRRLWERFSSSMEKFRSLVVGLDLICQQLVLNAPAKAEAALLVG